MYLYLCISIYAYLRPVMAHMFSRYHSIQTSKHIFHTGPYKSSPHIDTTITGSDCLIGLPIVQALHGATYRRVPNETHNCWGQGVSAHYGASYIRTIPPWSPRINGWGGQYFLIPAYHYFNSHFVLLHDS